MNNSCYRIEDIQKELVKMVIQFVYTFTYIDQADYHQPIKYFFASDALTGSSLSTRHDEYFLKPIEIQTDGGFILSSYEYLTSFQLDTKTNYVSSYNGVNIFEVVVAGSNLKDIYQRKYIKIQDVIASIGGFIKGILLFFTILNNHISAKFKFLTLITEFETKLNEKMKEIQGKSAADLTKSSVLFQHNNYILNETSIKLY
jgi:hypothetical protein